MLQYLERKELHLERKLLNLEQKFHYLEEMRRPLEAMETKVQGKPHFGWQNLSRVLSAIELIRTNGREVAVLA
jgi:hypothetical protein